MSTTYTITGHVIGSESNTALPGLRVELWDSFYHVASAIAYVVTDADGAYSFSFTDTQVTDIFGSYTPLVIFKIYDGSTLKMDTNGSVGWMINANAAIDLFTPDTGTAQYVISGIVHNTTTGHGASRVLVEFRDAGHAVATPAYTVTTDANGYFQYAISLSHLHDLYGSTIPTFYFQVVNHVGTVVGSTEGSLTWSNTTEANTSVSLVFAIPDASYTLSGHLTNAATGNALGGLRVEAWDLTNVTTHAITTVVSDEDGAFSITVTDSSLATYFGINLPQLYFKIFDGTRLLRSTEDSISWTSNDGNADFDIAIDIVLPGCGDVTIESYTVTGTVKSPNQGNMGGLQVQIVDLGVGGATTIASATTDECGRYSLSFPAATMADIGKRHPDLQARVYSGTTLVASSTPSYNVKGNVALDVTLPASTAALGSEHDALTQALAAYHNGNLRDLQENDDRQDITYLANKSGWDARAVALAATADDFSSRSTPPGDTGSVDPAFFYALFRAGLPANENILYHTDAGTLSSIWNAAAQQGVISEERIAQIPEMTQRFHEMSVDKMLTGPAITGPSTMQSMLEASSLSPTQQGQFASIYAANRGNPTALWSSVESTLGAAVSQRLQVDGKLAFMTINNAPLMAAVRTATGGSGLTDLVSLAQNGLHRASAWSDLLGPDVDVPDEIPGDDDATRRSNYAEFLAAQVRLSYPTASVANMVSEGDVTLANASQVATFLTDNHGLFEIGIHPVDKFIAQNELTVDATTVASLRSLQRVYQITPSDEAISGMLDNGLDAAAHVIRYDKENFVSAFADQVGGAAVAAAIHDRSVQVHNTVLNVVMSYVTASRGLPLGTPPLAPFSSGPDSARQLLQPAPKGPGSISLGPGWSISPDPAADVPAYGTLESLFGSMDFCSCDECRSILSPAAYLVDLLGFLNHPISTSTPTSPLDIFLARRPDVQHLPLTCENTNTALPYIDVVNETLEYYVTNLGSPDPLVNYTGHDTGTMSSADLLANPAYVLDTAYATLANQQFPLALPFHRPLEILRRYFDKFGVRLPLAMERLREHDDLERGGAAYGWRDTLMEEIRLSRQEHAILTDSSAIPLWRLYGFTAEVIDDSAIPGLANAKALSRRLGISYEDLIGILETRFVNPNTDLVPKLERLGVSFLAIQNLNDGTLSGAAFDALLPTGAGAPDPAEYGGDIKAWITDPANYTRIMRLILLTDVGSNADPCSFDTLELRYSRPMSDMDDTTTRLTAADYYRINRFVRLWKKLGWTIQQTDAAICALYRADLGSLTIADLDAAAKLDTGFLILLPRLGVLVRVMRAFGLTPMYDLLPLLALWSDIGTYGEGSLYRQLFLNPANPQWDPSFVADSYGNYPTDSSAPLFEHTEELRAAFNITGEELNQIIAALGFTSGTQLTLANISEIFRRGYLARAMRISVLELLQLMEVTGLDPFAAPDPTSPAILRLADLVRDLKSVALKPTTALYLVWNQDLSGDAAPSTTQINQFIRALRNDFSDIEKEFAISDDPTGEIGRARMTLVYGTEATDFFFGLLNDTFVSEVSYSHITATFDTVLKAAIATAGGTYGADETPRLGYDDYRKRLTFTGILTDEARLALRALPLDPDVIAEVLAGPASGALTDFQTYFPAQIDALYTANSAVVDPFFDRYGSLLPLYQDFIASHAPAEEKRATLLDNFVPTLVAKRKYQQAFQRLADAAQVDRAFAEALVDASPASAGLNAVGGSLSSTALKNFVEVETLGLTVEFFDGDTIGADSHGLGSAGNLIYEPSSTNTLPPNITSPGSPISGRWTGSIEVPEESSYDFFVEADASATVGLKIGGATIPMTHTGTTWSNGAEIRLKGGTLYSIEITVEKVIDTVRIQWGSDTRGITPIPSSFLYASTMLATVSSIYLRFLKAAALASALKLTVAEISRPMLSGASWLNALPTSGSASVPSDLVPPLRKIIDYAMMKAALSPGATRLLDVMNDLSSTPPSIASLQMLTAWDTTSLDTLVQRFNGTVDYSYLAQISGLRRVFDAFALIATMGITAKALVAATTNDPTSSIVRDFQSALRARYAVDAWRDLMQPINDSMRALQRDALVSYILYRLSIDLSMAHIDTVDKLFEYFLMDVEMEPCMQTSRIRHALSSVQLFIERCIMNLEPEVPASSLSARQWEWMKRYRVWEANRKVFLFPENWLEPELRDDKSPFFKEIESELLQSDITEETAASAMLKYLSKLEEVARLEPAGFYHIPADPTGPTAEINHVVARTPGTHRKYFYRRREYGYWTAWEEIKLDIEDNPVVPVVWRDRLLLLWVRLLKKGPETTDNQMPNYKGSGDGLSSIDPMPTPAMVTQAVLCWSEYYDGKWQAAKTSDLETPMTIYSGPPRDFNRRNLRIDVNEEGDCLRVNLNGVDPSGLDSGSFLMYNTHSTPGQNIPPNASYRLPDHDRMLSGVADDDFSMMYMSNSDFRSTMTSRQILKPTLAFSVILPQHSMIDLWSAPMFYQDKRHVFYVSCSQQDVPMRLYSDYGIRTDLGSNTAPSIPGLVSDSTPQAETPTSWTPGGAPQTTDNQVSNVDAARQIIREDSNISRALGTTAPVTYGDTPIGATGRIMNLG